jgi:hypothetical protein
MTLRARLIALAFLLAATLATELLYLPAAGGGFLGDDFSHLDQAQTVPFFQHPGLALHQGAFDYFQPVPALLWNILYSLFGLHPLPYHLFSIGLHLLVTSLLLLWVDQIAEDPLAAGVAGLFFAVLPSHPEAVTWISANADLLASVFSLAAIMAYHRFSQRQNWRWFAVAILSSALAMLSKEFAFLLPLLIPLFDLTRPGRVRPDRNRLIAWGALWVLAAVLWAARTAPAAGQFSQPTGLSPISQFPWNWLANFWTLLWPRVPQSRPVFAAGLWTLAVAGILALGLIRRFRTPALLAPAALLVLGLVPGSVLNRVGPEAEFSRILYFPSLGLAALLGIALTRDRSWPALAVGVPAALIAFVLTLWSAQPWVQAGNLSLSLAKNFQGLSLPLEKGDALLVAGVPLALHGAAFHNNSYTLSVALSLAQFPEEFRRRGFTEREQLPLYAISPAVPAIEAEMLTIPRLRRLKRGEDQDFRYRLIWQYLRGTFTVVNP